METIIVLENRDYPSLNTFIRKHWAVRDKMLGNFRLLLMTKTRNRHLGKVTITIQRHACKLMDWDNMCGGFKAIGDALRYNRVIPDDKPEIVVKFIPEQYKVAHKPQERVVIRITDV